MVSQFQDEDALFGTYDSVLVRWMLRYARPYRRALAGCVVLLLVLAGLMLSQPFIIKNAIDNVMVPALATDDPAERARLLGGLPLYAWLYVLTTVLAGAIGYAESLWLRVTGQRIIARVRQDVFEHLQTLSLSYFDRNPVGRLVTRATNDVEALNEMYTAVLVDLFRDVFIIAGTMALMLALDWRAALVAFAVMPVVGVTAYIFRRYSRTVWRAMRLKLARINATLAEYFAGMRVVQIFGREERTAAEFRAVNDDYYRSARSLINVFALFNPTLAFLNTLALALVIWIGGGLVLQGTMTFGVLYAFTDYLRRLFEPINGLAEKYNILQSALASAERLSQLMAVEPEVEDPAAPHPIIQERMRAEQAVLAAGAGAAGGALDGRPADGRFAASPSGNGAERPFGTRHTASLARASVPAVAFDDVHFRYQPHEPVLRGISFDVAAGETVAFVGHTGAGKSTIMSLLPRFYDVQEGAIRVHGIDVREWPQAELRRHVGLVMQDVFLFAGDVASNIGLHDPAIDRAAIEDAARIVGADPFIRRLPSGYDEPVVERGLSLSAGQRQLISFARAMAYDPEILILDEATASVDAETEAALQHAVRAVKSGRTTLIVAHRLATVRDADRIVVMHKGRIVEQGAHDALLAKGGHYRRLWEMQFADD